MKKIYQSPQTQEVTIETQQFVATSSLDGQQEKGNFSVTTSEEEYNGEGASRYYDDWD